MEDSLWVFFSTQTFKKGSAPSIIYAPNWAVTRKVCFQSQFWSVHLSCVFCSCAVGAGFTKEPFPVEFAFIDFKATRRFSAPNSKRLVRTSNQLALQPCAPVVAWSDRLRGPRLHWLTPLLFNGVFRCHSHSHGPECPYTCTYIHKQSVCTPPCTCTHTLIDIRGGRGWSQREAAREGGHMGIAPTGGTLLDLWMRQKSHYGLLWLTDRSLSAAELHTKAAGRS